MLMFICIVLSLIYMEIVNNNMAYAFEVENKHSKREKNFHKDYD